MLESKNGHHGLPLVSILIPVFNKATVVHETLDSALAQSYPNTELIVVNDGSTDGSLVVLQEYAKEFPEKIRLVDSPNQGVSAATNLCIHHAKGEYIQFLDADDLMSPRKIEAQVTLLNEKGGKSLATCTWNSFRQDLEHTWHYPLKIYSSFESGLDMLLEMFDQGEMMQPGVFLTPRILIDNVGPWNEQISINQDGEFFCRVLLEADSVLFEIDEKVYYRKPGRDNVSQQRSLEAAVSQLESYRCYEQAMLGREDSQRVRRVLAKNYLRFSYVYFPHYPDLLEDSYQAIRDLRLEEKVYIGGPKFQFICRIIGYKNALQLKRWL